MKMSTYRQLIKPLNASVGKSHLGTYILMDRHVFLIKLFKNYIPKTYIAFNDEDPPWLNEHIRLLSKKKKSI